jgi:hypothetical protein
VRVKGGGKGGSVGWRAAEKGEGAKGGGVKGGGVKGGGVKGGGVKGGGVKGGGVKGGGVKGGGVKGDERALGMGCSMGYWSRSNLGMSLDLLLCEETFARAVLYAVGRAVA